MKTASTHHRAVHKPDMTSLLGGRACSHQRDRWLEWSSAVAAAELVYAVVPLLTKLFCSAFLLTFFLFEEQICARSRSSHLASDGHQQKVSSSCEPRKSGLGPSQPRARFPKIPFGHSHLKSSSLRTRPLVRKMETRRAEEAAKCQVNCTTNATMASYR